MITGNKGEWSEIYALFKILADKEISAGDGSLNKIEGLIYPVIKILRDETDGNFEFSYDNDIVIVKNNNEVFRIPIQTFRKQAQELLEKLQAQTKGAFSIPITEEFLNSFNSKSLKAKSTVKSDIQIVIHDLHTGATPLLGFSIKSQLGSASTLLNAGKTTNFIYEIEGEINDKLIEEINSIETRSKIKDRLEEISNQNLKLNFFNPENNIFESNMVIIDSALPKIISEIVFLFYTSPMSRVVDLTTEITSINPINYSVENNHPFYEYKIKRFLTDIALGMMPSVVWTGKLDATGGYLIIKNNGDILCYHIYNLNEFENYLFYNTKLETASSSKHDFGKIYQKDGKYYINLNLQIRFL